MIDTTATIQKFETAGREAVAARLEKGYFNEAKAALAKAWLAGEPLEPADTGDADTDVKPKKPGKGKKQAVDE